jgi:predicted NBD/HSP70 family sugar kinase
LGEWKRVDIRAELDSVFDWPVYLFNDGTVSAGAELMFGAGLGRADFFYVYVGDFVVGGVVLDRHLFPVRNKLAGAIGNMPVPIGSKGGTAALSDRASLNALASRNPGNGDIVWSHGDDWSGLRNDLDEWIEEAANGLAHVAASAVALIDVDCIVVDGAMPAAVRRQITRELRRKLAERFLHRPESFTVTEGSFGLLAPAIGGASIPLLAKYSNDKETLFKDDRELTRRG